MTRLAHSPKCRLDKADTQYESSRSGRDASGLANSQPLQFKDLIEMLILIHLRCLFLQEAFHRLNEVAGT